MKSLKEIVYSTECELYAIIETNLKQNEDIVVEEYKWVGKNTKERERWRWSWNMNKRYINKWYDN